MKFTRMYAYQQPGGTLYLYGDKESRDLAADEIDDAHKFVVRTIEIRTSR